MNKSYVSVSKEEQLRETIKKAIGVFDVVKTTLGARGRNVALPHKITKDGVSVARELFVENPEENFWVQVIKEVAKKTNDDAGDGTTSATVLAQALISEGLKNVTAGANPMELKKGIDLAVEKVVEYLENQSIKIKQDSGQITQIATISANGDAKIGGLIGEAFSKVGAEGSITVESSKTNETYLELVDGMEVESGYISPYFVNNFAKGTVEFDNPLIFVSEKKIQKLQDIQWVLEHSIQEKRPVLFIAAGVENEGLSTLITNTHPSRAQQGKERFSFAAVNAPSFGEDRNNFLEDIATATGARVISDTKGFDFHKATLDDMGQCEKVIVSRNETVIIKGKGEKKAIESRMDDLRRAIKDEKEEMKERMLRSRLAKLNGAVAILNVGGSSEAEVKEKLDRIEDAVNATRAASEEGIIPGGGVCFVRASKEVLQSLVVQTETPDVRTGINIVRQAIQEPLRQIVRNAKGAPDVVVSELLKQKKKNIGYDVANEIYVDMLETGIIDPKKVARVALENAASVAGLVLTTEGALTRNENN